MCSTTCAVDDLCKIAAGLLRSSVQLSQPFLGLCDHVYSLLQLVLQFGDVHLVRDAIGVADAFHIAEQTTDALDGLPIAFMISVS